MKKFTLFMVILPLFLWSQTNINNGFVDKSNKVEVKSRFAGVEYPAPREITAIDMGLSAQLDWLEPILRTLPINIDESLRDTNFILIGYNIYRDSTLIGNTAPNELSYIDYDIAPGTYIYGVTAVYGEPDAGESVPVTVELTILPQVDFLFEEYFTSGDFTTNNWTFEPEQGNWAISEMAGNPAPSAQFGWQPSTSNYSNALISKDIDATAAVDNVTLEFDVFLDDYANSSAEKMQVYVWNGNSWVLIDAFVNAIDIPWTTKTYNITNQALGKVIKLKFVASGELTFDIDYWRIDNIKVFQGPFVLEPMITVSPSPFYGYYQSYGDIYTGVLTIGNIGQGLLNWSATIEYTNDKNVQTVPGGVKVVKSILDFSQAHTTNNGGAPEEDPRDVVILHYDDDNFDGIGLTNGGSFTVAARYPSAMMTPYLGYKLVAVDVYINDAALSTNLRIYGAGTNNAPGALIYEQSFNGTPMSWNTITLNTPVITTGTDIWVGYSIENAAGKYPAGCDDGPANPNGDWISTDGLLWEHLSGFGLNYNWNIRAKLSGSIPRTWLTMDLPHSGTIANGETTNKTLTLNSTDIWDVGLAFANINIVSNDPLTPVKVVPVEFTPVGLNENPMAAISIYPVPASDQVNISLVKDVIMIRIFNYLGQKVIESRINGEMTKTLNIQDIPSGVYTLQFTNKQGEIFNKSIIVRR